MAEHWDVADVLEGDVICSHHGIAQAWVVAHKLANLVSDLLDVLLVVLDGANERLKLEGAASWVQAAGGTCEEADAVAAPAEAKLVRPQAEHPHDGRLEH